MTSDRVIRFGTDEPPPASRTFSAGALKADFSDGAIRHLSWHGTEIVRGIACPIRDANWATHASVPVEESISESPEEFEISQLRLVAEGALRIKLTFKGRADGTFQATTEMWASREVITNRAGFTLLHPLRGVAGEPLLVDHPDGSISTRRFPLLISPDQPADNIAGLRHNVDGIDAEIAFQGEIFEMEDQRNWSDASFKTYCRPLSLPRPYSLKAGQVCRQDISIRLRGAPAVRAGAGSPGPGWKPMGERIPHLAVSLEAGTIPDPKARETIRLLGPAILQLRLTPETAPAVCGSAGAIIASHPAEIELEIVVPAAGDPPAAIAQVAGHCRNASLAVARVLALPERYLLSYQPGGPWPAGPAPQDLLQHVRTSFPEAGVGGGVLTYFTELNRCRPPSLLCDYISHGSTAITHAADDESVIESLEGLAHIFKSSTALAAGKAYRLGLVAVGMRTNPYGAGVADNPRQQRIAMAGADPRQRGLFAAAWAVGAMAATQGHLVSSLALSALVGPFGVIHRREAWPQPLYQDSDAALVYPLFHVVRFLSAMGGAERMAIPSAGNLVGVASRAPAGLRLVLANLGSETSRFELPRRAQVRILNARSFAGAIRDPKWLDASPAEIVSEVTLAPLDVAFAVT
jgi:hypothetical protein